MNTLYHRWAICIVVLGCIAAAANAQAPAQGNAAAIAGIYDIFLPDRPNVPAARMSIRSRGAGDDIMLQGIGQIWSGQGKVSGQTGFYDWSANGRSGRTEITFSPDGSVLRGHVYGPGQNYWYTARRVSPPPAAATRALPSPAGHPPTVAVPAQATRPVQPTDDGVVLGAKMYCHLKFVQAGVQPYDSDPLYQNCIKKRAVEAAREMNAEIAAAQRENQKRQQQLRDEYGQ